MAFLQDLHHITTFVFDLDGVLTDGTVYIDAEGEQLRAMNIKDGYALQLAVKKGYHVAIISGGTSQTVLKRFHALGIPDVYLGVKDKQAALEQFLAAKQASSAQVLYMGDDMPDREVMRKCLVATCPADACEEIKAISHYISPKAGGKGCVRDVIERVLKVQQKWSETRDDKIASI